MRMQLLKWFAVAGVATLCWVAPVSADYINLPVKWSQPIEFLEGHVLGAAYHSDDVAGVVMADDFLCTDPLPVYAIRWWGVYLDDPLGYVRPTNNSAGPFDISFYNSAGVHPNSLPSTVIKPIRQATAQEEWTGMTNDLGLAVYRYDAYLPATWRFPQTPGREYFLALDLPSEEGWAWQSTPIHTNDWAAISTTHYGPWNTYLPHVDLTFEIMVVPEPSTWILVSLGAGLVLVWRWRRQK